MQLVPYLEQTERWPSRGRHLLAQHDAETVVVYQAYRPAIGRYAALHGRFGGDFSFGRMSWIKPGFLWMMHRSGWGTKPDQEVVLAITLKREGFDAILAAAVPSSFDRERYATKEEWQRDVETSDVRLQWDPDHDPNGAPLERRAIQLGLRGPFLERYAREWTVRIEDVSLLVAEQRAHASRWRDGGLTTPLERPYPIADAAVAARLRIGQV